MAHGKRTMQREGEGEWRAEKDLMGKGGEEDGRRIESQQVSHGKKLKLLDLPSPRQEHNNIRQKVEARIKITLLDRCLCAFASGKLGCLQGKME